MPYFFINVLFSLFFATSSLAMGGKTTSDRADYVVWRPSYTHQSDSVRRRALFLTTTLQPLREEGYGWWKRNFLCKEQKVKCSYVWIGIGVVLLSILFVAVVLRSWYKANLLRKRITVAEKRYELKQYVPKG